MLKRIQALVIPAREDFRGGARRVRHMDVDRRTLADPVETANSLLKQFRIQRQIEQN